MALFLLTLECWIIQSYAIFSENKFHWGLPKKPFNASDSISSIRNCLFAHRKTSRIVLLRLGKSDIVNIQRKICQGQGDGSSRFRFSIFLSSRTFEISELSVGKMIVLPLFYHFWQCHCIVLSSSEWFLKESRTSFFSSAIDHTQNIKTAPEKTVEIWLVIIFSLCRAFWMCLSWNFIGYRWQENSLCCEILEQWVLQYFILSHYIFTD